MKTSIKWTEEMLDDIKNFTNENMSSLQVSIALSDKYSMRINRNQIIGAARRNNIQLFHPYITKLQKNNWSPARVKKLEDMWSNNFPIKHIAKELGISFNTVSCKVKRLNLKERNLKDSRQAGGLATKLRLSKNKELKVAVVKTELLTKFSNPVAKNKKFLQLKNRDCRFVIGDGKPEDFIFCAAPAKPGSAYCEDCHKIVYIRPTHNLERIK